MAKEPSNTSEEAESPPYKEFSAEAMKHSIATIYGKKAIEFRGAKLPKTRRIDRHYEKGMSKQEALGGARVGVLTKKNLKASHSDPEDIYYRPTLFKHYPRKKIADTSIREILATHLYNLANSNIPGQEATKTFLARGSNSNPQVGVRFHKNFETLQSLLEKGFNPDDLDAGRAFAQSFWLGDPDGHFENLGAMSDFNIAVRIDFDLALKSSIGNIIEGVLTYPEIYPSFIASLYRESFVEEMLRLSSMSYHKSPQFSALLDSIFEMYNAHSSAPLDETQKGVIKSSILANTEQNCIEMKFLAETAKLNVIIKKEGLLSEEGILAAQTAAEKLLELEALYPKQADDALFNALKIFNMGKINEVKSREIISIISDVNEGLGRYFLSVMRPIPINTEPLLLPSLIVDNDDFPLLLSPSNPRSHQKAAAAVENSFSSLSSLVMEK